MKEISWETLKEIQIGHAQNEEARTGVTVVYFPQGARVGCDISGGGPASRETPLTSPLTADNPINAIVLGGGSAFGLAASDGVMQCLEEHGIGYDTGLFKVPLVLQSDIYDLTVGDGRIRPDAAMGREACERALAGTDTRTGRIGGGTGATVGKILGMQNASESGLGAYAVQIGPVWIAAMVIVNAVGDIYDSRTGRILAGVRNPSGEGFLSTVELLEAGLAEPTPRTNTTIGMVATNASFQKAEAGKLAEMVRCAYSRAIRPVATMMDGDTVYFASVGDQKADLNVIGTLAAEVMEEAIRRAVTGREEQ